MKLTMVIVTKEGRELKLKNWRERKDSTSQPPVWTETTVLLPKK